jgi:hypothetical protein
MVMPAIQQRSMKQAYFDTNVFTHIYHRTGVTDFDVTCLRTAIAQGRIRVLLSTQVLEETIGALRKEPDEAMARLQIIFDLTTWTRLLKFHADLLRGEIECYAFKRPMPSAFYPENLGLKDYLLDSSAQNRTELVEVANETQSYLQWYKSDLRKAMEESILPIARQIRATSAQQSFDEYWQALAVPWVEGLAEDLNVLRECRSRGMGGLLAVKSVHLFVFATLSLTYAQTYEGNSPQSGDSRDMQHAILASAADTFVTDDATLLRILTRRPIPDLKVMDLPQLIGTLDL